MTAETAIRGLRADVDELKARIAEIEDVPIAIGRAFDRPSFSGTAYYEGYAKTTGLNTYPNRPWVKLVKATQTFTEEASDPSDPWPAGEHWWRKANTFGDIHYWLGGDVLPAIIVMWSGDETDIPDGWALCDGTANSVGNGGSGRDLSGRFIVGFGSTGTANTQDYAVGDTGGYQHHGNDGGTVGNVNNHTDHDLDHYHLYSPDDPPTQNAAAGSDVWAWGADPTNASATCWGQTNNATWNGAGNIPGTDGLIVHSMTDNRPPFYALCFIEKLQ